MERVQNFMENTIFCAPKKLKYRKYSKKKKNKKKKKNGHNSLHDR